MNIGFVACMIGCHLNCGLATVFAPPREPPLTLAEKAHWSYISPIRPAIPSGSNESNPVDAYISSRLQNANLEPVAGAEPRVLLRRVTFDLTGLPPTLIEQQLFQAECAKNGVSRAYSNAVDRLLGSVHFGEHWAQHWLDLVRYAETNGYELDADRPHAWRYRDYVIRSFNADKPYSEFLIEQLAGDELAAGRDPKTVPDLFIATGMNRCGPVHVVGGNTDAAMLRQEKLTEIVDCLGSTVLGLTIGCARCHDHKFEAISAADYYRLQGYFATVQFRELHLASTVEREEFHAINEAIQAKILPLKTRIGQLDAPVKLLAAKQKRDALPKKYQDALAVESNRRTPQQAALVKEIQPALKVEWTDLAEAMPPAVRRTRDQLRQDIFALEAMIPAPPAKAWAIEKGLSPISTFILKRGDPQKPTSIVTPGVPRILRTDGPAPESRLAFARSLVTPTHPLTARVMVNRIWQHLFGVGIVATPNDFGTRGQAPSNQALLDWLATEFVQPSSTAFATGETAWSVKRMIRGIVLSKAYQRQSEFAADHTGTKIDPDNKLLWRMNRKRLGAESIRDALFVVAGTMNPLPYGPSVRVPLEPEVYDLIFTEGEPDGLWPITPDVKQHSRRSIYLFAKRNVRLPLLEVFDQPTSLIPCARRDVSTFSPQALIMMNGPTTNEQSTLLAKRIEGLVPNAGDEQLAMLYRICFAREATARELKACRTFVSGHPEPTDALRDLALALVNTSEFVYLK